LICAARAHGATVVGSFFESTAEDSLRRNQGREGKKRVPGVAIHVTIKRLERPTMKEGFDRLFHVRLPPAGGFEVTDGPGSV